MPHAFLIFKKKKKLVGVSHKSCIINRLHFFFSPLQGFRQDLGFQELGGTIKKTPQKKFFSRKSGRRALRARLPAGHRVERRRVHQV